MPLGPNWTSGRGQRPPFLPFPLFLPFPSLPLGGFLLGLGVLVGTPPWVRPLRPALIGRAQGGQSYSK